MLGSRVLAVVADPSKYQGSTAVVAGPCSFRAMGVKLLHCPSILVNLPGIVAMDLILHSLPDEAFQGLSISVLRH